jgi:DNA-directed RNA polymerase subunit M/transcription elongation factor TFIIS
MKLLEQLTIAINKADWDEVTRLKDLMVEKTKVKVPITEKQRQIQKRSNANRKKSRRKSGDTTIKKKPGRPKQIEPTNGNPFIANHKSNKVKGGRPEAIRITNNKFIDSLEDHPEQLVTLHPELGTRGSHVKNKDQHETDTSQLVKVQCSKCGKIEYVRPILATNYDDENPTLNTYKCNDCITSR